MVRSFGGLIKIKFDIGCTEWSVLKSQVKIFGIVLQVMSQVILVGFKGSSRNIMLED
jgi:hypothetical protein